MVLEDLQDPGNLGTIMRTGEGAGIDGDIVGQHHIGSTKVCVVVIHLVSDPV